MFEIQCQEQREADPVWRELNLRYSIVKKLSSDSAMEQENAMLGKEIYDMCQEDSYFKDAHFVPDSIHVWGYLEAARANLDLLDSVDSVEPLTFCCSTQLLVMFDEVCLFSDMLRSKQKLMITLWG